MPPSPPLLSVVAARLALGSALFVIAIGIMVVAGYVLDLPMLKAVADLVDAETQVVFASEPSPGRAEGMVFSEIEMPVARETPDASVHRSVAEALSGVGSKIQQRQQAGLDLAYQDFQNQRDYPIKQLSLYSQLLSGSPVQSNTSTTTTGPAPDWLSQLLGVGTSIAGLASLFG